MSRGNSEPEEGRAVSFFFIWMAPIVIAVGVSLASNALWMSAAVWSAAFAWTGAACLVNARRCGRLHCFFSGPLLLLGALFAASLGLGVADFGAYGLAFIVAGTLVLSALHLWAGALLG